MNRLKMLPTIICFVVGFTANEAMYSQEQTRTQRPNPEEVLARLDEDKDGKISKEEAKGPISNRFADLDANQDDYVSLEELQQAANQRQQNRKRPNPENVLARLDADKDGKISKEEAKGPISNRFANLDANQDEYISLEELQQAANQRQQNRKRPDPENVLARLDVDKDGRISKEEAKGPLLKNFAKVDKDNDQYLTLEELKNAPKPRNAMRGN